MLALKTAMNEPAAIIVPSTAGLYLHQHAAISAQYCRAAPAQTRNH